MKKYLKPLTEVFELKTQGILMQSYNGENASIKKLGGGLFGGDF